MAAGVFGLLLVLGAGILVLIGIKINGVEAADLVGLGGGPPDLMRDPQTFDLEAASKLGETRNKNDKALGKLRLRFFVVAVGLVLEVAGLAVAAEAPSGARSKPATKASLRVTSETVGRTGVRIKGGLRPSAAGGVVVLVTLYGRGAQTITRAAPLKGGRFAVRITAKPALRPVRSATYTITWTAPSSATNAQLTGSVGRGSTP